jgi:release factor glutamine methyltransferase
MRGRVIGPGGRRRREGRLRPVIVADATAVPLEPRFALDRKAPPTIREAVALAEAALDEAGVEESIADSRLLLASVLGASPTWVFAHEPDALPGDAWNRFRAVVERRRLREPLQHLLGVQGFWSLELGVGPEALIPRPETEVLVEATLAAMRDVAAPRIADIGTGTGAIALALASELPAARLVATDISEAALSLARRNARNLGFDGRIEFRLGSLCEPLHAAGPFDAVAANLPYVTSEEWKVLEPEVRDHEPPEALVGGEDGLDLVRELVAAVPRILAPGGWLGLEIGWRHAAEVRDLLASGGFCAIETRQDFAGIERVISGRIGSAG